MSINNNLLQINTFAGGMNTDVSDALLPSNEYRYARNLRYFNDAGEDTGELRLIEGYEDLDLSKIVLTGETIVAVTSIRDLVILLINCDDTGTILNNSGAEIIVFSIYDTSKRKCPFFARNWKWNTEIKYSFVTRWESDKNVKLYIADGENELMSLNIIREHNSSMDSKEMLSGANADYLREIKCSISSEPGNIRAPKVLYSYYLYTEGSGTTDISPLSEFVTLNGVYENKSSGKSIDISIDLTNVKFKKIKLFRIEYVQNGQVPNVYVAADVDIDKPNFKYNDAGNHVYSTSFAEYRSIEKLHIIPKIIESKLDYLFAANIEDITAAQDIKFKDVTVTYSIELVMKSYIMDFEGTVTELYIDDYGPSLMVGETYRYGFIFYTKDGKRTSVLNITDVVVDENINVVKNINYDDGQIEIKRLGVSFNINGLPNDCIGFDVVRCERTIEDSNTITQGIIGCTFGRDDKNLRYASPLMSMQDMIVANPTGVVLTATDTKSLSDITMFSSPETAYQLDDTVNALKEYKASLSLEEKLRYQVVNNANSKISYFTPSIPVIYDSDYTNKLFYSVHETNRILGQYVTDLNSNRDILFYNIVPFNFSEASLKSDISDFNYIESPIRFDDGLTIQIGDNVAVIDDKEFYNWEAFPFFKTGALTADWNETGYSSEYGGDDALTRNGAHSISSGKKCILLKSNIQLILLQDDKSYVSIINIKKNNSSPYGGNSEEAKKANTFYSYGNHYITSSRNVYINVYNGDVYNCMFIYNSSHAWYSSRYASLCNATIYAVPVQTRIDLTQRHGDLWPDLKESAYNYFFLDIAGNHGGLIQDKDAYLYNTAYSINNTARSYYPSNIKSIDSSKYDTRVFCSELKTNGESVDNWTIFKPANFLDVDSRYGEITGLRLFKNSLVCWLKNATSLLAVNERTLLLDVNDTNIILGNGDVLQRYDYLTTRYGMAPGQLCDAQSDTILYWWDEYNRDIVAYPGGNAVQPLKRLKNINKYINDSALLQQPTIAVDKKYNEVLFYCVDDASMCTLAYSELISKFTSVYKITFDKKLEMPEHLILFEGNDAYVWNKNSKKHKLKPYLQYVVNDKNMYVKVFDNMLIGMGDNFYYNLFYNEENDNNIEGHQPLTFEFKTQGQSSTLNKDITKREYDIRLAIPRANNAEYCDRMRGRTMQCDLTSSSSSTDFSIQYIITKYRISWS